MKRPLTFLAALLFALSGSVLHADIVHDEDVNGDLSDDNLAPTVLVFQPGSNEVHGSSTSSPLDRDFLTISINNGFQLSAVILQFYSAVDDQSFFAVEAGPQVTSTSSAASLLGSALIGDVPGSQQGDDVLDDLGIAGLGGSGFTGPLGPGTYTFWYQETAGTTDYEFNFIVQAIPEPTSICFAGIFGVALLSRRRR